MKFRPHHFLCTLCFQGKGYSPEFVQNYQALADILRAEHGDETLIEVVAQTDHICSPCPHKREALCETQAKIVKLDTAHANALGLKTGEKLTWGQAKARIAQNIDLATFEKICEPCSWKASGMCREVLTNHLNKP
ncbi:MAG: DUF1284 domain-containing protein [Gammaproteobacteria bacterium]|nr:DUF1284 domain-containing protein [Gammaproteobacteria bacterium]